MVLGHFQYTSLGHRTWYRVNSSLGRRTWYQVNSSLGRRTVSSKVGSGHHSMESAQLWMM